jgi:TatA/E family protein of Tat protein translocase
MDIPPTFALAAVGSVMQWVIILVVVLLLFGRRLPALLRDMGGSVNQFRKGINDGPEEPPAGTKPGQQPAAGPAIPESRAPRS